MAIGFFITIVLLAMLLGLFAKNALSSVDESQSTGVEADPSPSSHTEAM